MARTDRPTEEQRKALRDNMNESFDTLGERTVRSVFDTFIDHVKSPEGKPLRELGAMVDAATNGLLSKAIRGIMTSDDGEERREPRGPRDNNIKVVDRKRPS